ncbi:hypothetical protein NQ318_020211 [Aromia moschata]|uniref:Peptidase M16C associated domain-containing protein n=1 Tax=Aromia moschata TaxID=1265417 RepID=A0AAV8Z9I2_9CUCU|nr:hypothetical protein NQ318_020211 [Aromia moschata]
MPPVDRTPSINTGNFELLHSLQAYDRIPISEYISNKTGLTVVIAEVDGPVVNGYFCLVTEALDDDGLPHTLEHLIFLGSEEYPYKGVLDLLANRCLASGTNAWTDIDHTCYTMETAGSEGFLALMPIFLEHILYPVLREEGFITEVHHITGEGEDAGVVYCEMQGRENSAESRLHLAVARNIYPGKCGYSSETGGIMKNLRESTNNTKVRDFHKEFYRPENLKIVITGQVKPNEVFKSLERLEQKLVSKGCRGSFQRPWQTPVPPDYRLQGSGGKIPGRRRHGLEGGPSCVTDLYTVTATTLLLKYLTEFSVSPLPKEFVEIEDPYASNISYNMYENSETCVYITFEDVPVDKLPEVRPKLQAILKKILDNKDIDMKRMESIINRYKLESLSNLENSPHHTVAFMIIGHMLYGTTKGDLQQRVNPLTDLQKLLKEPQSYWLGILEKYLVENKYVAIQCVPSREEKMNMAREEKERIEEQIRRLTEAGLREKKDSLEKAIEFNEREPPMDMVTSVPIPSLKSIKFHNITRYSSASCDRQLIDLSETPVFTYFDHLKTSFVYIFALLNTSCVPAELRSYLPILLESILELPIERDGKIIPYEEVVAQLNDDTVSCSTSIGLGGGRGLFKCGNYSQTWRRRNTSFGMRWLKELLYKTVFTADRLKVIAMKMNNTVSQVKRSGRSVVSYAMKGMCYSEDSNVIKNGVLQQSKFLTELVEKIDGAEVLQNLEKLRKSITDPANFVLYIAGNLDTLKNPVKPIDECLPHDLQAGKKRNTLISTPDYKLLRPSSAVNGCIIGMGCLESSFFYQTTRSITDHHDPDLPPLMLYLQVPCGSRSAARATLYGYTIMVKVNEGLLYLMYSKATNVVGAYKETKDIIARQLEKKEWDGTLLESARSSLIFEIIDEEKTIGNVVALSVSSYFQNNSFGSDQQGDDRGLESSREKYVAPLFESSKIKTAVVTDPAKANEIAAGFQKLDLNLEVYSSLEESFLNTL